MTLVIPATVGGSWDRRFTTFDAGGRRTEGLMGSLFCTVARMSNQGHPAKWPGPGRRRRDPWRLGSAAGPPDARARGLILAEPWLAGWAGLGTVLSESHTAHSVRLMRRSSRPEGEGGRRGGVGDGTALQARRRSPLKSPVAQPVWQSVSMRACVCLCE